MECDKFSLWKVAMLGVSLKKERRTKEGNNQGSKIKKNTAE